MRFVVDENIPYGPEAFGTLGEVTALPGKSISASDLREADGLIVRTVTQIDASLLEESPARFVGTSTIGEDHVDRGWLNARGIAFASAPGCNANSVGEYLVSAWLTLEERGLLQLQGSTLGIVGYGNVGKKAAEKAAILGIKTKLCDPPLAASGFEAPFLPLDDLLDCGMITFHVPLTKSGPHATRHLADADWLQRLNPEAVLFNTSRGPVVDNAALLAALQSGGLRAAVLDVWEDEPLPAPELVRACALATPHIAGYSIDGKLNATQQIYEAACRHFGEVPSWNPTQIEERADIPVVATDATQTNPLIIAVRASYDIRDDDTALREIADLPQEQRAAAFEDYRRHYPRRWEFRHVPTDGANWNPECLRTASALGFTTSR